MTDVDYTSSTSMPSVVAEILAAQRVEPGMSALEIGTDTGWNAALLAHRLGGENLTSVEIDPDIAAQARKAHLREVYGVRASRELISKVTDVVADEIEIWRNRPVDEVYPIVCIDGIRIKVRDEGAKFWLSFLTELRNRGLRRHPDLLL